MGGGLGTLCWSLLGLGAEWYREAAQSLESTRDRRKSRVRKVNEQAWFLLRLDLGPQSENSEDRVQIGLPNKMPYA